jgi:hypothetical protein
MVNNPILSKLKHVGVAGLLGSVVRRAVARPIASFGMCRGFFVGAVIRRLRSMSSATCACKFSRLRPYHIFIVARKPDEGEAPNNDPFTGSDAPWRRLSPFAADKGS